MKVISKEWIKENLRGDPVIWFVVFALCIFSILVVYSATGTLAYKLKGGNTEHYLLKHSFLILLSILAMWATHRINYRYFAPIARMALWISVPLLLITYKFGLNFNEASRTLTIPIINQSFQPSDLAKLALIVSLARMLAKRQQKIEDIKESLIPMLFWCGIVCGLIALTNFSSAVLLFSTCMLLLFIGRVPVKYLVILVLIGALFGSIAFSVGQRGETVSNRISDFMAQKEIPFQAKQSFIAIATGGISGKGPGQSDQRNFLPNSYDDFIYAIIIEEYGMIGGLIVVMLYLAFLFRGMKTASESDKAFGGLLSAGLSIALVLQAMVNMAVVVGLGPITGMPLPMISMGGTSLLFTGITFGIVLSVSRNNESEENFEQELVNS